MISIKKITLMISLLCAVNMRALSPAEIAIGIAAAPVVPVPIAPIFTILQTGQDVALIFTTRMLNIHHPRQ